MLNIRDLEERWEKYNKKRKRPLYIILLGAIVIFGLSIGQYNIHNIRLNKLLDTIYNNFNFDFNIKKQKQNDIKVYRSNKQGIFFLLNSRIMQLELKEIIKTKPKKDEENFVGIVPIDSDEIFNETDISKPVIKKKSLNIIKVSNSNAYKDVENRFRRSHNVNDSIFLTNIYYKRKNYKKAIYWAKQTNKIDNNIEETWLIFAKSKVKLGYKNEAIRVLKAYISRSNSYEAKKMLKQLLN